MDTPVPDLTSVIPIEQMKGDCEEDTKLLQSMFTEATEYLESLKWFPGADAWYFGYGVGGVLAVFLAHLKTPTKTGDTWVWVVVGDIPSAYLDVCCYTKKTSEALQAYCMVMEDWANAVKNNQDTSDKYPVGVAPTQEHASMLRSRINFIRKNIINQV